MTVDLAEFFDVDVPEGGAMEMPVVQFTISDTGRIFWNGKHMTAKLYEYCDMACPSICMDRRSRMP